MISTTAQSPTPYAIRSTKRLLSADASKIGFGIEFVNTSAPASAVIDQGRASLDSPAPDRTTRNREMTKRKQLSGSTRWHVLARDGFTCRYCGARAGQVGVELAVDHVISVKDGGDDHPDNLVTACRRCNGGKSSRSLSNVPTAQEVIERVQSMAANIQDQVNAARGAIEAKRALDQEMVNIKCDAYGVKAVRMQRGEYAAMRNMVAEFGADLVLEWYSIAAAKGVKEWDAIRYVCGIARNIRLASSGDADV